MDESSPRDDEPESPASRVIAALLDGGEAVDDGHFTIDPAAAADKLAAFTYLDRDAFLVPLVEGLLGLGASEVAIERSLGDLLIRAHGIELDAPAQRLLDLHAHALQLGPDAHARALGRLAIGLDMLLSGSLEAEAKLTYSGEEAATVAELRGREAPRIRVDQAGAAGELRVELDPQWLGGAEISIDAALDQLRDAVRFSPMPITIDGERVSQATRDWLDTVTGEGPGYRFTAGLEQRGDHGSTVELWTGGIRIEGFGVAGRGFTAAIELDAPRRDLSQMQVVRDAIVQDALAAVEHAQQDAVRQLESLAAGWTVTTRPPEWTRERVDWVLGRRLGFDPDKRVATAPRGHAVLTWKLMASTRWGRVLVAVPISVLFVVFVLVVLEELSLLGEAFGLAVLLTVPAQLQAQRAIRARDRGLRVRATIDRVQREPLGNDRTDGRVWWRFTDMDGVERSGHSLRRTSYEADLWTVNEQITVYYDRARPERSWWEADVGPPKGP